MRATRRLGLILCLGLFLSGTGAVWLHHEEQAAAVPDDPTLDVPAPVPTTTLAPTTVPATVPPTAAPPPARPARVPSNPYANEPMVLLGSIEIPKIGLNHQLYQGISLRSIDRGPSHWPGTALPGQVGNVVVAGHRVTHSKPFRNIDQLAPGDEVVFTVDGTRTSYEVTGSEVVGPKALHIVDQTPTPTATLFACHPPGSARYRYVVHLALRA